MLFRILLFFNLFFVVNAVHFRWQTGIPALAPINVLVLLILFTMRGQEEPLRDPPAPLLLKPLLIFYGALALALLWAQVRAFGDVVADFTYLKNALFYPLFYFIYLRCRQDEKTTRGLLIWILVIAAVAALEAIREGFDYGFGHYDPSHRASGPFGNDWRMANRAGVFYAIFMPMFVALALFLRRARFWRTAAIGGCVLLAGGVLFTYSRQSYFLVLLAVALLLLRRSFVLAVVLAAVLISLSGYLPDAVTQRVDETKQTSKTGEEQVDVSTASRWELWAGGMQMLMQNPLGVGLRRFQAEIGQYSSYKGMDAHNFYVLTVAECGPQGLVVLLYLIFCLFRLARYLRRNTPDDDPETKALTLGFTITTVCMALGGVYGSPTLEGSVMGNYWALCGLLERYILLKKQNAGQLPTAHEPSLEERFPLAAYLTPGKRG